MLITPELRGADLKCTEAKPRVRALAEFRPDVHLSFIHEPSFEVTPHQGFITIRLRGAHNVSRSGFGQVAVRALHTAWILHLQTHEY